jgi:hypothetical protein
MRKLFEKTIALFLDHLLEKLEVNNYSQPLLYFLDILFLTLPLRNIFFFLFIEMLLFIFCFFFEFEFFGLLFLNFFYFLGFLPFLFVAQFFQLRF